MAHPTDDEILARLLSTGSDASDVERATSLLGTDDLDDHERLVLERFLSQKRGVPVIPLE